MVSDAVGLVSGAVGLGGVGFLSGSKFKVLSFGPIATHIGAGARLFRAAEQHRLIARMGQFILVKLRRSVRVERWRGLRQSLASRVSPRCGYVPLI